jgi:hypothetical protein
MLVRLFVALLALAGTLDAAAQPADRACSSAGSTPRSMCSMRAPAHTFATSMPARGFAGPWPCGSARTGLIYVVAESGGAIHKYRNDTLEYAGVYVNVPNIGATGLGLRPGGDRLRRFVPEQHRVSLRPRRPGLGPAFLPNASACAARTTG